MAIAGKSPACASGTSVVPASLDANDMRVKFPKKPPSVTSDCAQVWPSSSVWNTPPKESPTIIEPGLVGEEAMATESEPGKLAPKLLYSPGCPGNLARNTATVCCTPTFRRPKASTDKSFTDAPRYPSWMGTNVFAPSSERCGPSVVPT